jgi:hypothetical protein
MICAGVRLVRDEMQHGQQEQRHGLSEIDEQLGFRVGEDLGRLAQVGLDHGGVRVVLQHEPAVRHGDLVAVHVDDPCAGRGRLGDLVDVLLGGDAGTDVEELPDAGLADQVPDGPAEKCPVGPHHGPDVGVYRDHRTGHVLVGPEIVATAQPVVVHAGDVRLGGVDLRRDPAWFHVFVLSGPPQARARPSRPARSSPSPRARRTPAA